MRVYFEVAKLYSLQENMLLIKEVSNMQQQVLSKQRSGIPQTSLKRIGAVS